jgi:hypothetical protein
MMSEIGQALQTISYNAVNEALDVSDDTRQKIAGELHRWLVEDAAKRNVNNLVQQLDRMKPKLQKLGKDLKLTMSEDGLIISADNADSDMLISQLTRGSDWFQPHPNLGRAILQVINGETSK